MIAEPGFPGRGYPAAAWLHTAPPAGPGQGLRQETPGGQHLPAPCMTRNDSAQARQNLQARPGRQLLNAVTGDGPHVAGPPLLQMPQTERAPEIRHKEVSVLPDHSPAGNPADEDECRCEPSRRVTWVAYSLIAVTLVGLWLMQSAFTVAPLHTSLPGITAEESVTGIVLGVVVFGDSIRVFRVSSCSNPPG